MGSYVENNICEKRSHAMQQEGGYFNDSVTHLCVCVCVCLFCTILLLFMGHVAWLTIRYELLF